MATRRDVLRLAGAGAGLLLGGCARKAGTTPKPATGDLLHVATTGGLAVLGANSGDPVIQAVPAAVATPDWRHLVSGAPGAAGTQVTVRDIGGSGSTELVAPPGLAVRAAAPGGRLVALCTQAAPQEGASDGSAPYRPPGRDSTTIAVVGTAGERYRFTLAGCLEPEAFTVDGARLFVLDYLPPRHPDSYRVRVLDLATGAVGPLAVWPKQLVRDDEEWMRGEGRQAVYDERRHLLFTLYTRQSDHAFVHTLSLVDGWAYCVDLPVPFGQGPAAGHAIARTPDGTGVYVVAPGTGAVAAINPDALNVSRTTRIDPATGTTTATASPDSRLLFVGAGDQLVRLDAATLATTNRWTLPAPVRGVAASPGGRRLYVGQPDAILTLDAVTGATVSRVAVPGLVNLRHASRG
jgi:hypothetical protein